LRLAEQLEARAKVGEELPTGDHLGAGSLPPELRRSSNISCN
jgi:hypothetical protein